MKLIHAIGKKTTPLFVFLMVGGLFLFMSSTSISAYYQDYIEQLSEKVSELDEALETLKIEKATDVGDAPFVGEIAMFGGNFAPRGWAFCNGQLLPISQNSALFSLLGTTYGGDGRTTFGLPDLRGRVPMHPGNGPGLSSYRLGQKGGVEYQTDTYMNTMFSLSSILAGGDGDVMVSSDRPVSLVQQVNAREAENRQPFQTVNFIIALQGTYPSRN